MFKQDEVFALCSCCYENICYVDIDAFQRLIFMSRFKGELLPDANKYSFKGRRMSTLRRDRTNGN